MGRVSFLTTVIYMMTSFGLAVAGEVEISAKDRTNLAVTLYSNGFAMIDETRTIRALKGINNFALTGIANQISTDTVLIEAEGLDVLEIGYDKTTLSPHTLLERNVGKEILIENTHPQSGKISRQKATLISINNGIVVEINGELYSKNPSQFVYPSAFKNQLRTEPALTLMAEAENENLKNVHLSYLARGFSWRANYIAVLNQNETALELTGRATLTNSGGMDFENAAMTLIAGQVNAPQRAMRKQLRSAPMAMSAMSSDAVAESAPRQSFSNQHLYTLPGLRTLRAGESKQAVLFKAPKVKLERRYVFTGGVIGGYQREETLEKANLRIRFINNSQEGLGVPLPSGTLNAYKKDKAGILRYVGQNNLGDIPIDKTGQLALGKAFDISLKRIQTDFKYTGNKNRNYENAWKLEISNSKAEEVLVTLEERMHGDWKIIQSSQKVQSKTAQNAVWQIKVPANGKSTLTYRVAVNNR